MLFSPAVENAIPTLADVQHACQASRGNVTYRKNAVVVIDAVARRLGVGASMIELDPTRLRYDLVRETLACSASDFAVLWHGLSLAIRMSCLIPLMSTKRAPPADDRWNALKEAIGPHLNSVGKAHLPLFIACAAACDLAPSDIKDERFEEWAVALAWTRERCLADAVIRNLRNSWSALARADGALGLQNVTPDGRQRNRLLPWRYFPPSLEEDVEKALAFSTCPVDLEAMLPPAGATRLIGVNPATVDHYRRRLKACSTAYVRGGGRRSDLTSVSALLTEAGFARVVAGHLRKGGDPTFDATENCRVLILIGRTFCRIGEQASEDRFKRLAALPRRSFDLHVNRRTFLENVLDPLVRPVFAALPQLLFDAAVGPTAACKLSYMQAGLLIDLSRSAPLEPGHWQRLRWDVHLKIGTSAGSTGRLILCRSETDKTLDFSYEIAASTADRLRRYRRERGSMAEGGRFVFANRVGRLNSETALSTTLRTSVLDFADLDVCLTDLRFLSEYAFLAKDPTNLEGARQAFGYREASPLVPLSEFILQNKSPRIPRQTSLNR